MYYLEPPSHDKLGAEAPEERLERQIYQANSIAEVLRAVIMHGGIQASDYFYSPYEVANLIIRAIGEEWTYLGRIPEAVGLRQKIKALMRRTRRPIIDWWMLRAQEGVIFVPQHPNLGNLNPITLGEVVWGPNRKGCFRVNFRSLKTALGRILWEVEWNIPRPK